MISNRPLFIFGIQETISSWWCSCRFLRTDYNIKDRIIGFYKHIYLHLAIKLQWRIWKVQFNMCVVLSLGGYSAGKRRVQHCGSYVSKVSYGPSGVPEGSLIFDKLSCETLGSNGDTTTRTTPDIQLVLYVWTYYNDNQKYNLITNNVKFVLKIHEVIICALGNVHDKLQSKTYFF